MKTKIAFLYVELHPLHKKYAEKIGCEILPVSKNPPKNYEVYIVEGTYMKPLLLKKLGKIDKKIKIITLFSDPRLFYLSINKKWDFKKNKMVRYSWFRSFIAKRFLKRLDGAIIIEEFTKKLFRKINKKCLVMSVPAFIFKKDFNSLEKTKPNLSNNNIVFIGHGPDFYCKGIDILIESFSLVKKEIPDAQLYILGGKWERKKEWERKGVNFEGTQKILPYLKKSSLSIHLGRGESFGINILESMLAGIPIIVSEYTGAKQAVEKFDKNFIVKLDKKRVSKKIIDYFRLSLNEKKELSKKCKKVANEFNEKDILDLFEKEFIKFIKEVYKNEDFNN